MEEKSNNSSYNQESDISSITKKLELKDIELPQHPQESPSIHEDNPQREEDESDIQTEQMRISHIKVNISKSEEEEQSAQEEDIEAKSSDRKNENNDDNKPITKDQLRLPLEKLQQAFESEKRRKVQNKENKKKVSELIDLIESKLIVFKRSVISSLIVSGLLGIACFFFIIIFCSRNKVSTLGIVIVAITLAFCGASIFVSIKTQTALGSYLVDTLSKLRIGLLIIYAFSWVILVVGVAAFPFKVNVSGFNSTDIKVVKACYQMVGNFLAIFESIPIIILLSLVVTRMKGITDMMQEVNDLNKIIEAKPENVN
jgi:hypothetical protein